MWWLPEMCGSQTFGSVSNLHQLFCICYHVHVRQEFLIFVCPNACIFASMLSVCGWVYVSTSLMVTSKVVQWLSLSELATAITHCVQFQIYMVTTCLENLEMSGNLTVVRSFTKNQGNVFKLSCQGKLPKTVYCKLQFCVHTGIY